MRKKKDLPLAILKALEAYVNFKGEKFEVIDPKENLLKVIDKDLESKFHFTIENYKQVDNRSFQFLMTRIPRSANNIAAYQAWVEISGLGQQFEIWLNLLDEYESVKSFFDDPITKSFKDEFYAEFEIVDEKAETHPLSVKQILLLDSYLEEVESKLIEFTTQQNSAEIQEIRADIILLRDNLTTKSKQWVINNLTNIWAKIARQGPKFIKEFLSDAKKEIIKQGVKFLIDYVKDNGMGLH